MSDRKGCVCVGQTAAIWLLNRLLVNAAAVVDAHIHTYVIKAAEWTRVRCITPHTCDAKRSRCLCLTTRGHRDVPHHVSNPDRGPVHAVFVKLW